MSKVRFMQILWGCAFIYTGYQIYKNTDNYFQFISAMVQRTSSESKKKRVRISLTFSVLRPFSYLRPFLYFDFSTSSALLRLAYIDLCTSTFCQIWISYCSRSTGRSTRLVEVKRSKYSLGRSKVLPRKSK